TNSNLMLNSISMVIMIGTGFVVGWRFTNGVPSFLAGIALILLFSYAFSWVMALLGMVVRTPETINNASFMVLFPITFISNAFVPAESLPRPLEIFADWNPVSALVQAARDLFGNTQESIVRDTFGIQYPVITVLIGVFLLLLVFVPLCIRQFARTSSR
ncbi:MAG TPA: ABC transporter permease, partial [Ornithinimicrobium sp.]|uniref:ABC transporter permease n=1 Tax=Ornithinimicrobium sp. TaxID=1977084 RepID=UPI002B48740D